MRRVFGGLAALILVLVAVAAAAVWYVKPVEPLDLRYEEVSFKIKALEMIAQRRAVLTFTEEDVNNLLKAHMEDNLRLPQGAVLTGARFRLTGDVLQADLNLRYRSVPVGLTLRYRLLWHAPELVAVYDSAQIREFPLPEGWLQAQDIRIDTSKQLPPLVRVKDVRFLEHSIELQF